MTITRKAEYRALENITLSGAVLDLGGLPGSDYHRVFQGTFSVTTANLGGDKKPDIVLDLEQPLPVGDASFDGVTLINVLEHIFEYRQLLREAHRVLRSRGDIVIVVPFLIPFHASPWDFHRYTHAALERALAASGFSDILVRPLGSGVFSARWALFERLLPRFLQPLSLIMGPVAGVGDCLFFLFAKALGRKYQPADYALAYCATARKI